MGPGKTNSPVTTCAGIKKSSHTEDTHSRSPVKKIKFCRMTGFGQRPGQHPPPFWRQTAVCILCILPGGVPSNLCAASLQGTGDRGQVSATSPTPAAPLFRPLQPRSDATFLEPPSPLSPHCLTSVSCIHWQGILMISTRLCPLFRYSYLLRTSWEHTLSTLCVTMTPSMTCRYTLWSVLILSATVSAQTESWVLRWGLWATWVRERWVCGAEGSGTWARVLF